MANSFTKALYFFKQMCKIDKSPINNDSMNKNGGKQL